MNFILVKYPRKLLKKYKNFINEFDFEAKNEVGVVIIEWYFKRLHQLRLFLVVINAVFELVDDVNLFEKEQIFILVYFLIIIDSLDAVNFEVK